ncbi:MULTISPECIES: hypothetical protein [Ensifer]|uniref:Transposase n=1 Tax=Ensifer adhaerens TaxID=106592 RepID=A0ABY8HNC9_ENSAD|nr:MULTISPECIES: hypothetical protein [Ensifer]ANK75784.1 hypothetical protein FA04_24275 [Ensifer adhaerens]KDP72259.1 hypothetical protein FA04_18750 [Ensifer adhaerens]KQZ48006.1 hypothetical protein ASD63_31490 [Ensifer sp. Root558]WFP92934.1 hypothetical protein P4B07_24580 [Ensifer adhaerens]SFH56383.1 hypothetical protein SAMN05216459_1553 [Ensifer sp. OV372]
MTKHQIEVITPVKRRRRWTREEKDRPIGVGDPDRAAGPSLARESKHGDDRTIELGGGRHLRVESDIHTEALAWILDVSERR